MQQQTNIFEALMPTFKFPEDKPIRLFESFAGVGMQRMALNRLKLPYISVGISEIDKYAIIAYAAVHCDLEGRESIEELKHEDLIYSKLNNRLKLANELCNNYGDICKMQTIPDCDIFTYSFPCTDLSKAGKQAGLNGGTRSGLVYEVIRLLKATANKPKVLIMENVVDLVQVNFIKQFNEIQREIELLGYTNYTEVLNAKDYGVAQNRERVFMVSILGDYYYEFPKPFPLTKRLKDYLEKNVDEKYYLTGNMLERIGNWKSQQNPLDNILGDESVSPTPTARGAGEEHSGMVLILGSLNSSQDGIVVDSNGIAPTHTAGYGNTPKIAEPIISILGNYTPSGKGNANILDPQGISQAVMENHGTVQAVVEPTAGQFQPSDRDYNIKGKERDERFELRDDNVANAILTGDKKNCLMEPQLRIRKLTPLECWRLMSIDDSDFYKAQAVVSNSQLYRQAGNGLIVNVFAGIIRNLI